MALKGNLQDFNTTQLLNLVHLAHKTGALQFRQDSQYTELFFRDGKLIHATMTGYDSLLTSMLVQSKKLAPEQAKAIQAKAKERDDKRLAMILIQNSYISKEDVIQSVTQYILDIVYHLFSWTEGQFFFEPDKSPDDHNITVPIDLGNVIMEGSRRVQERDRLQDELPDLDMSLKFTDQPDAKLRNISLSADEWKVISYVKPSNTIRRIAKANGMNDFQIRKIVYGMLQAGLVELIRPPGSEAAPSQPTASAGRTPSTASPTLKRGIVNKLISRIKKL